MDLHAPLDILGVGKSSYLKVFFVHRKDLLRSHLAFFRTFQEPVLGLLDLFN